MPPARAVLVCLLVVASARASEPAPVPTGMDILYSDHIALGPGGEPLIAIGIATAQERVRLRAETSLTAEFYDAGTYKRTTLAAGATVELTVRRAAATPRRFYVDVAGVRWNEGAELHEAVSGWRARGYPEAHALEEGTVLGIHGQVLDNREYRVVLPAPTRAAAVALRDEVYERFGTRASVEARLAERPWGEIYVASGAPLGTATSYVRFTAPGGLVEVADVEFARGYAWAGKEDRRYRGEIYVTIDPDGRLATVNVLGAERVLAGVVPSEMFASSPPEALKAQAVAARNHLLAMLGRRHHDDPFHLCADQHCQVYAGIHKEDARASEAVQATFGEALFLNDGLVEAVYSSTCGGHTEDNDAVWGDAPNPALRARPDFDVAGAPRLAPFAGGIFSEAMQAWIDTVPESYCAKAKAVRKDKLRWTKTFSAAQLDAHVARAYPQVGKVARLVVEDRGPGGRVVSLRIVGARGEALVVHELPIRRLFDNLSSGAFVVEAATDAKGALASITFKGGGWGHGVGMCQLGAIGRAESGQSYQAILAHYFNGAQVLPVYHRPTAVILGSR